jgi:hypothetical protein
MEFSFDRILAIFAAIAVFAGLGVAVAMDTKSAGELRFAQACFVASAILALVFVALWGVTTSYSAQRRVVIVMLLFAAIGLGLVEGIKWAQQRHDNAEHSAPTAGADTQGRAAGNVPNESG